jgi:hypothetical protein
MLDNFSIIYLTSAPVGQMVAFRFLIREVWQKIFGMGRGNGVWVISDPRPRRLRRTRHITQIPFPDPSRPQRKRPLRMVTERSVWVSYPRDVRVWPQRNIWREVWLGFWLRLVTNSTMARLMRSLSLIWYRSQMVVISSLRVSGILRQVWYGCLVIGSSFRHSGFWRSLDSPYPVFVLF